MKGANLRGSQALDDLVALDLLRAKPEGVFPAVGASRARRLPAVLGDEGFDVFNLRVPLPARVGWIVDQDTIGACRSGGDLRRNDDDLAPFSSVNMSAERLGEIATLSVFLMACVSWGRKTSAISRSSASRGARAPAE